MSTFVLVGGAWIGAWVWQDLARDLRARGHVVYPVTPTGLGERVHLARPDVDLDTHIQDVVNLLHYEDLEQVVLVGHSYAGSVVTGVADRAAARLSQLVFLDSAPFADGQSMLDVSGPEGSQQLRQLVDEQGDGWRFPPPTFEPGSVQASLVGLSPAHLELLRTRSVAHPFATYTQQIRLTASGQRPYQRVYVLCEDGQRLMHMFREQAAAGVPMFQDLVAPDWHTYELPTGHWPMLSMPTAVADILDGLRPS
jgi:pimeloyl-ACP methyl ester carboxylesterase